MRRERLYKRPAANLSFFPSFPLLPFLQIHPLKGETIQVQRMRQGLLPVADPRRPPHPPPGELAAQVPPLRPRLQPTVEPEDPPPHPHRHQALQLCEVRKGVPPQLRPPPTHAHPQLCRLSSCWSESLISKPRIIGTISFNQKQSPHLANELLPRSVRPPSSGVPLKSTIFFYPFFFVFFCTLLMLISFYSCTIYCTVITFFYPSPSNTSSDPFEAAHCFTTRFIIAILYIIFFCQKSSTLLIFCFAK